MIFKALLQLYKLDIQNEGKELTKQIRKIQEEAKVTDGSKNYEARSEASRFIADLIVNYVHNRSDYEITSEQGNLIDKTLYDNNLTSVLPDTDLKNKIFKRKK